MVAPSASCAFRFQGEAMKLVVLAAAMALVALPGRAADPIKIGVTIAQSPPGSVIQGTQVLDALQATQKILNDAGGVLGRPIELVVEDTQGLPEKARAAVEKLITLDKVVAITGEHQSSNVLAGMEVAHRYHIPYMNVNGWADAIRQKFYSEEFNPANYSTRTAVAMADTMKKLGAKRVVALAENTDYGIGAAKSLADQLKIVAPDIRFSYETLDRTAKDFSPVILSLKANPPDAIVEVMLPPAAYLALNQLYEQGVAPTAKTWLYDGSGLADYPDFWQNVSDAAKDMIVFGLYHPKMAMPALGKQVADAYAAKTGNQPNRLLFQASDSLLLLAEAIKQAKSTEPDAMVKALEGIEWEGTRGLVTFSTEKDAYKYHQWIEIPYVTFQITAVNQSMADTSLVQGPDQPLEASKLQQPAR
jgi:branched-chain amino acid transport system substrate-binding protein